MLRPVCACLLSLAALASRAGATDTKDLARFSGWPVFPGGRLAIAPADLDHDGDPDLVTASIDWFAPHLEVLVNLGEGRYAAPVVLPLLKKPADVAVGDVNGDLLPDIVASEADLYGSFDRVAVFLNTGTGAFGAAQHVPVAVAPSGVALGNVDGDADLDIVVAHGNIFGGGSSISVLRNAGNGTFAPFTSFPAPASQHDLALGDVDHDGDLDAVTAGQSGIGLLRGNGAGGFSAPVSIPTFTSMDARLVLVDLSGDGWLDVAETSINSPYNPYLAVLKNNGAGGFLPKTLYADGGGLTVGAWDADDDSDLDLVTTATSDEGRLRIWINNGQAVFGLPQLHTAGTYASALATADMDGDGRSDLFVATTGGVEARRGLPGGGFEQPAAWSINDWLVTSVDSGDIDRDGDVDVAVAASPVYVFWNDGTGSLALKTVATTATGHSIRLADGNEDGFPDLFFAREFDFTYVRNLGNGTFAAPTFWQVATCGLGNLAVAEVTGDGHVDVILGNAGGGPGCFPMDHSVIIVPGNGNGTFADDYLVVTQEYLPDTPCPADLDGDGDTDIAAAHMGPYGFDDDITILHNGGTGVFGVDSPIKTSRGPRSIVALDIDRDGDLDLATGGTGDEIAGSGDAVNESLAYLFNDGTGHFGPFIKVAVPAASGLNTFGLRAADLNLDGWDDLVLAHYAAAAALAFYNQEGSFGQPVGVGLGHAVNDVEPADLDGDGRPDLVAPIGFGQFLPSTTLVAVRNSGPGVVDVGLGLAGAAGEPSLDLVGSLLPGEPVLVELQGAAPFAPVTLVLGLSRVDQPFKSGVLVPAPDALLLGLLTDSHGTLELEGIWPASVPTGLTFWMQAWIKDASGPSGFAASNGLQVLVP